jgi:ABC-type transporter Mla subunit MlaD
MGADPAASTTNQLNPELQTLIQQYMTVGAPALSGLLGSTEALTGETGGQYSASIAPVEQVAGSLANFQALSPADIAQLSSAGGAAVESAGQTAQATSGGVPNAALQDKNLSMTAGQQVGQEATQLGQVAAQQNLGAKVAGGNLLAGLSQEELQGLLGSLSTTLGGVNTTAGLANTGVQGGLGVAQEQEQQQASKNQAIGSSAGGLGSIGATLGSAGKSGG